MTTIARDMTCPKCGYWETYQEVSDDGSAGCRKCGWRVRLNVLESLLPAQRAAYLEALRHGHIYESARGRMRAETPGRRQYSHHTIHSLRHLGLIEQDPAQADAWHAVDTAATQWVVVETAGGAIRGYFPTESEARNATRGRRDLTHAAPGYVPRPPTLEQVAVELSREDWQNVLAAVEGSTAIPWVSQTSARDRILAALSPAQAQARRASATTKEA